MTTAQSSIHSGFGPNTTALEVLSGIDLREKTALVTGGASGLGLEAVRALATAGAQVIVPARSSEKAARALNGLKGVEIESIELGDPKSIDAVAERFLASGRALHMLVNDAGIMAVPLERDMRGYESHFSTNHLGHFQLAIRLLPALRRANGARVVSVSSWGHRFSPVHFEDPHFERREYERWSGYGQSKTANILFAVELDKRYAKDGIRAFALHPGSIVATNLVRHISQEELRSYGVLDERGGPLLDPSRDLKSPEQGAATIAWCAASPQLDGKGGVYCEDVDIAPVSSKDASRPGMNELRGDRGVMPYAIDSDAARRLWQLSEELIG